jgi:hypothetical protein
MVMAKKVIVTMTVFFYGHGHGCNNFAENQSISAIGGSWHPELVCNNFLYFQHPCFLL